MNIKRENIIGFSNSVTDEIQNIMALGMSLLTYCTYASCYFMRDYSALPRLVAMIGLHCVADLPFAKNEMILHHLFCLGIIAYLLVTPFTEGMVPFIMAYTASELSTVFLVFRNRMSTHRWPVARALNDLLFVASFFACRVVLFYTHIIANKDFHASIYAWSATRTAIPLGYVCLYVCTYGLFILNLYWFVLILKKAAKRLGAQGSTPERERANKLRNEFITKYSMTLHCMLAATLYRPVTTHYKWLEMASVGALTATSYLYHNSVERATRDCPVSSSAVDVNVLDDSIVTRYLADIAAIYVRSSAYLVMITAALPPWPLPSVQIAALVCTVFVHADYCCRYFEFVLSLKECGETFLIDEPDPYKTNAISWRMGVPIGLSTVYIMLTMGSLEWAMAKGTAFVLIALGMYLRPLYDFNHAFVHVLILAQAYVMIASVAELQRIPPLQAP